MVIKAKSNKKEIEETISKGGSVLSDNPKNKKERFCLYIPGDLLRKVEAFVEDHPEMSKTFFIVEAIRAKLKSTKGK